VPPGRYDMVVRKRVSDNPTPLLVPVGTFVQDVVIILAPFTGEYKEGKSRRPY
jgi:hypothetical protein